MPIKYVGNDSQKSENGKIHVQNGNFTGCGARIDDNPQDWVQTSQAVTCEKKRMQGSLKLVASVSYNKWKELTYF